MKRTNFIFLLCILAQLLPAQIRFAVTVKDYSADFILVEKPIHGKYFPQLPEKVLEGKKGRFLVETADETSGFLTIHLGEGRSVRVFLEPGNTSSMEVNMGNFERSLKFSGPQSSQNKFLQGLDRSALLPSFDSFAARSGNTDSLRPKDLFLSAVDHIEAEKSVLQQKGRKKFSPAFLAAMEQDIKFYHTCRFTSRAAQEYENQQAGHPSGFSPIWAEYWEKSYQLADLAEPAAGTTRYFLEALDTYLGAYRLGHLEENEYLDPDLSIGEQFLEYDRLIGQLYDGENLEYALAGVLSQRALQGKNEPVLFDLFQKFKNDFPDSRYLQPFKTAAAPIGSFLAEEEVRMPEGIIDLGEQADINSVEELLQLFSGKVIYLDVWATWCTPCLFEFRQSEDLEHFAEGKEIALLFVSVDNADREKRWQEIIIEHRLKGYHLLANFSLRDELIDRFGDGSTLALPRYMIFDKNGELVNENAKQPSHNSLLFNQLGQFLD